jgi:tetratricopeptide (TPR) repeat protein
VAAASSILAPAGAARSGGWLFGPLPDLLLGCGFLYALIFVAQVGFGPSMREIVPTDFHAFIALLLGAPHYGATLIRVFGDRGARSRYWLFVGPFSALMLMLFVAALHSELLGSWIVTLFLTWSPWHYSGQNYGITLLMLRRRGVVIPDLAKRLLYASFLLSFALVVVVLHGLAPGADYTPTPSRGTVFHFISLGIPAAVAGPAFVLLLIAYLGALGGATLLLLRGSSLRALGPAAAVVATQSLWFVAPSLARRFSMLDGIDPLDPANAAYAFIWVGVGHFVQYLWITTYYARSSPHFGSYGHFLGKALLAGTAIWALPTLLFAPGRLGTLPYSMGLGLLAAAVVNLHHFVLDGAIWKLRDGSVARILLREAAPVAKSAERSSVLGRALRISAWAAGITILLVRWGIDSEIWSYRRAVAEGDLARTKLAIQRLALAGYQSPLHEVGLASLAMKGGDTPRALGHLERSLALHPTADAWNLLGRIREGESDYAGASEAFLRAHDANPEDPWAPFNAGRMRLRLGAAAEASTLLAKAQALAPDNRLIRTLAETASDAAARDENAVEVGSERDAPE